MNYSFMNDVCMETPLSMIVSIGEIKHAGTAKLSTYCNRCLCYSFYQSPVIVAIPFLTSRGTEITPLKPRGKYLVGLLQVSFWLKLLKAQAEFKGGL